ncbi:MULTISPECIES: heme exporter protein CcmB [Acidobacterium]|uniref:Heme exporter protein B n=2 Tax=Acidobacterium capsulatum TaxID=33075 RepID=C1F367_ACIC5|nr:MULTISPECIES: heme exporter protein CcmB [Acidobacterium]ACO32285.1 putative heme exporter protein CcmB [Acidobacterium capsulatum ATCC 51196]HCT60649.1 heme ABC transporter permease CcmB [Acidobacterium sp.]
MKRPYVLVHLAKDLRIEWRSKDAANAMLFFALLVVAIFSLAFDPTDPGLHKFTGAILCVAIMFAAVSSLNQVWARELQNQVLDAQRMTNAGANDLFIGKVLANFLFLTIVEIILAPFFVIFYNLRVVGNAWTLAVIIPLGTWALVVNGVFFAALSIRTRSRELLLPLILLPIFIPALLAMVVSTSAVITGASDPGIWIKMLAVYDIIFTTVCLLLFDTVLHAEG